jgi:hypothetical protein
MSEAKNALRADVAVIVEFLKGWGAPFCLAHMKPDTFPRVRNFTDAHEGALWAAKTTEGGENIYFHVNPVRQLLSKKASKADILCLSWLHVDIDPESGETPTQAKARAVEQLSAHKYQPTAIVDSGGGVQAFWRLKVPVPISNLADAEDAERWNRALETQFYADNCHNCDRIMRLPGTINWPNARKLLKGRVPVLAKIISSDWTKTYDVNLFKKAPSKASAKQVATVESSLPASLQMRTLQDIDLNRIPEKDRDRISTLVVSNIDDAGEFGGDKSKAVWFVCCVLARAGVDKEDALGLLLNPSNAISQHIFKPQYRGKEVEYAWRQIERAYTAATESFDLGKNGSPLPTVRNIKLALAKMGIGLEYDSFSHRLLISGLKGFGPTLDDAAVTRMWIAIDEAYQFRPGKDLFWAVVEDTARLSTRNPIIEYLNCLVWDEQERIDEWLITYADADDNEFIRAVGSLILIAAVRRVREPGCKFDEMLVFESQQGLGKSTALSILAVNEDWFADDIPLNGDTKRSIESLTGRWIVEAAELKGMRQSQIEHMKAFLSRRFDRARLAYDRLMTEVPRQCVIIGTTNSERYLRDLTGNRRFWPVRIGRFDLEALKRDRDQLWAEASVREATKESIRLDPKLYDAANVAQLARRLDEPWKDTLESKLGGRQGKIRSEDIWLLLNSSPANRTQNDNERFGMVVRDLGFERRKLRFGRPDPEWCYTRGPEPFLEIRVEYDKESHSYRVVSYPEPDVF